MSTEKNRAEIDSIRRAVGLTEAVEIVLHDGGWDSRVYSFDNGRYFFKFPRTEKARTSYGLEVAALRLAASLETAVAVPKVVWEGQDGAYFGYEGVPGIPLDAVAAELDDAERGSLGTVLGTFLKQFGELTLPGAPVFNAALEAEQLQSWYVEISPVLQEVLTAEECHVLKGLVFERFPGQVAELGTDARLCHGDLAAWNLVYGKDGKVGIIDFGKVCYGDMSRDLVYVDDEIITECAMRSYGRGPELAKKVTARLLVPAINSLMYCAGKGNEEGVLRAGAKIGRLLRERP